MSQAVNIPREKTAQRMADALEGIKAGMDGTEKTYKERMRDWFIARNCNSLDAAGLTSLVDEWYETNRPSWCGYTEFYQPDVSAVSDGTKGGDNEGLTCTPSTDTVAGQDDYAELPLFACVDCNFEVNPDTLQPVITAIDGITSNFKRKDPDKFVGVLQAAGYIFTKQLTSTYIIGYSANRDIPYTDVEPLAESINPDGSVRSWVVHAKYASHNVDGRMASYAGDIPTAYLSYNTVHTYSAATGEGYSGLSVCDLSFMEVMAFIKYGSMTLDGILQGCCNNSWQYYAQVSESGVKRVILTTSNGANVEAGMGVLIGAYNGSSTDRGTAANYSITGQAGAVVTKVEDVTINGTAYTAVYVDTDAAFDTTANGSGVSGTTILSSFHWSCGSTDGVLGNDGSPVSNTSGKYPAKLQGIEYMNGAYEAVADAIHSLYTDDDGNSYYKPLVVRATAGQATDITDDYEDVGLKCQMVGASTAWQYIKRMGYSRGVFYPIEVGGSSTTYTRDGFYQNAIGTTGTREWPAWGNLNLGVGYAGLSCLYGNRALSDAYWYICSRLSVSGNRGEWAA